MAGNQPARAVNETGPSDLEGRRLSDVMGDTRNKVDSAQKIRIEGHEANMPQIRESISRTLTYLEQKGLKVDRLKTYFKTQPGDTTGRSTSNEIQIDPIMLLHPWARLAYVLGHEISHAHGKVNSDALVEAYICDVLRLATNDNQGGLQSTLKYSRALKSFRDLSTQLPKRFSPPISKEKFTKDIYDLYYSGNYKGIFEYCLNDLPAEDHQKYLLLINRAFPELVAYQDGKTDLKDVGFLRAAANDNKK